MSNLLIAKAKTWSDASLVCCKPDPQRTADQDQRNPRHKPTEPFGAHRAFGHSACFGLLLHGSFPFRLFNPFGP
jgi:hypothetical protein